ncbi:nucleolar complex protein 1 [Drosophila tropicalis]|uniref:nucleolar complex protein 1 n=1 Tax=Drosophila tropicalis TaxID=46794 RepID=UPI0035AB8759
MPAAVAQGIQINGGLKNKKIIFDDEGEALAKPQHKSKEQNKPQNLKDQKKQQFQQNGHTKPSKANHGKGQRQGQEQVKRPQKIKFGEDGDSIVEEKEKQQPLKKKPLETKKSQRIKFNDDGEEQKVGSADSDTDSETEGQQPSFKKHSKYQAKAQEDEDSQKKWYHVHPDYPSTDEFLDMKEPEQLELFNLCKSSFEAEKSIYSKRNPTDARWLQTALHKGTAKDRANAGALLVTSNPLGNLEALSTLIGFCKISNKASNEVIAVLTDLWQEVLLPPQRKLLSIHTRGADWKKLKKDTTLSKEKQRRLYSYWYFENELKDQYHEFLKNLMQGLQTGQDHNKNSSIVAGAKLLSYAPEKEQMLLTMLINKLGDPTAKIASKALHHLSEVAHRHPNMCGVIVAEAEKLLFRNNISERAQHFALCFLASIAPSGKSDVCTKLVNICFALFKVLVQKGAVNNRTMQAILRCLQKAIVEAQPAKDGNGELLNKEMQDTVYRLVHLADIRVSVQTLGLLLQLITVKTEKSDRFYNALYVKLLDLNLINVGGKTAAQLLHIVHRAIHIDNHVARAQAFVKRLLQLSLYAPPHIAAGCLIVLHKLLRMRRELVPGSGLKEEEGHQTNAKFIPLDLDKFGNDDEEETYKDAEDKETEEKEEEEEKPAIKTEAGSSWHHASVATATAATSESKVKNIDSCKYDPYHRVPAFAGAGYALRNELLLLRQHYHPTVQVFAEQILQQKRIDYYGDPLRDFGLPHFLERFAFKNPKKLEQQPAAEATAIAHKRYTAFGSRGKSVRSLTKTNCTEDEMFIFNFLEHKRKQADLVAQSKTQKQPDQVDKDEADENEDGGAGEVLQEGEVGDDEFEAYLDGYFGKKFKDGGDAEEEEDELNFLQELGGEMEADKSKQKDKKIKKKAADKADDDMDDIDDDWGDDAIPDEDDEDDEIAGDGEDQSDDETGSIDLEPLDEDDDDNDDEGSISDGDSSEAPESPDDEDDDDDAPPKTKKSRKDSANMLNERGFAQKLKHSNDMSSLFAAADDFSALLEETGKIKGQGTSNAVFNKDKSSDKQMKWEEKRRSNSKNYTSRRSSSKKGDSKSKSKLGKKRKH